MSKPINLPNKDEVYARLEAEMVKYADLIQIPVQENGEPFVTVTDRRIISRYYPEFSEPTLGNAILVRKGVDARLSQAQNALTQIDPYLNLRLTFGYRSLETQVQRFQTMREKLLQQQNFPTELDLLEEIHRFIAVPTVAGHPTGGAVDVLLETANGQEIEFGPSLYDFQSKDCYYASPFISAIAKQNRGLLRQCMLQAGFAPFNGEYWHFSYGDKEWAFYYQEPYAFYSQRTVEQVLQSKP